MRSIKIPSLIILLIIALTLCAGGCRRRIIEVEMPPEPGQVMQENTTEPESKPEPVTEPTTVGDGVPDVPTTTEPMSEPMSEPEQPPTETESESSESEPESDPEPPPPATEPPQIQPIRQPEISPPPQIIILPEQFESEPEPQPDFEVPASSESEIKESVILYIAEPQTEPENHIADITEIIEADIGDDDETKPSDRGGAVGLIIDLYTDFLVQGRGTLFECQRGYVYFETLEDYRTVNRRTDEHTLILESGGYNIAEILRDDALTVSDAWVIRRNPTLIVKTVGADVLGEGITDTSAAMAVRDAIFSRPDWDGINAVAERNILILSSQLLDTEEGRLIAKLRIARAMHPELFSEIDIEGFYSQIKESGGTDFTDGIYFY